MDLKMDHNPNKTPDSTCESLAKSPPACTVKHFKKSMIVEYEKIEPTILPVAATSTTPITPTTLQPSTIPNTEDSQSSVSSHSSTSSSSSSNSNGSSSSASSYKSVTSFSDPAVSKKLKNDQTIGSLFNTDQKNSSDLVKTEQKSKSSSPSKTEFNFKNVLDNKKNEANRSDSKKSKSSKSKPSKKTYCICRTSDTQRFMIACDKCDEWFHGDCVGVSQSLSNKIKVFFCHLCRRKKPSLTIRYKSKFKEFLKTKPSQTNLTPDLHSSFLKFQKENRAREKKEHELNSKSTASSFNPKPNHDSTKTHQKHQSSPSKSTHTQSGVTGDDLLNFVSAISQLCSDTSASTSNQSESFARKRKLSENIKSKTNSENEDSDGGRYLKHAKDYSDASSTSTGDSSDQDDTDGHEIDNNEVTDETENESFVEADSEDDSDYTDFATDGSRKQSHNNSKKNTNNSKKSNPAVFKSNKNSASSRSKVSKGAKSAKGKSTQSRRAPGGKSVQRSNQRKPNPPSKTDNTNDKGASAKEERDEIIRVGPVQCLGPSCTREALKKSKYCSEECGLSLAKNRLVHFLKSRIQQYNESPSYSKILNEAELDRINSEISALRLKLKDLEKRHVELDGMIDQARTQTICGLVEKEREQSLADSNETEIYCVTCGSLHTEKFALKHMEKCFNKIESQASFGSYFKTHIEGTSMFCDYYNPQTKMYCKRLKVMCPEHEKEKKVNEDEVCGCPLPNAKNILEDSKHEICLASKRNCSIHYKWEKLRRAHIDLEKLRIWLKLEELLEQKRINETSLNQRASLLSILLHQTKYTNESQAIEEAKKDTVV